MYNLKIKASFKLFVIELMQEIIHIENLIR